MQMSHYRDALLSIQQEIEELAPQVTFIAASISSNDDEPDELTVGASFLLFGIVKKLKAMRELAAGTIQENAAL